MKKNNDLKEFQKIEKNPGKALENPMKCVENRRQRLKSDKKKWLE